jgi:hypothetical protein
MKRVDVTPPTLAKVTEELMRKEIVWSLAKTFLFSKVATRREGEIPPILGKATDVLMRKETLLNKEASSCMESASQKLMKSKWISLLMDGVPVTKKAEETPLTLVKAIDEPTKRGTVWLRRKLAPMPFNTWERTTTE